MPRGKILTEIVIEKNDPLWLGKTPCMVDNALHEGPTQGNDPTGKLKGRNKRLEVRRWQTRLDNHPSSIDRALSSLSSGRWACMLTESRVIPMNFRTWEGRKVFFRGNRDAQFLKQGKDPAQSCCTEGGGCFLGDEKVIKDMNEGNILR